MPFIVYLIQTVLKKIICVKILQCASYLLFFLSIFFAENACALDRYKEKYGVSVDEGINRLKGTVQK